ncbi:unnamed protein product, partial [Allacma fusca]
MESTTDFDRLAGLILSTKSEILTATKTEIKAIESNLATLIDVKVQALEAKCSTLHLDLVSHGKLTEELQLKVSSQDEEISNLRAQLFHIENNNNFHSSESRSLNLIDKGLPAPPTNDPHGPENVVKTLLLEMFLDSTEDVNTIAS